MIKILIIDDNESMLEVLEETFSEKGYNVFTSNNSNDAIKNLKQNYFDIVITDLRLDENSGIDILKFIKLNYPNTEVIIITAYGTVNDAVDALHNGAYDFIIKPFQIDEIESKIEKIIEHIYLVQKYTYLQDEITDYFDYNHIIGNSKHLKQLLKNLVSIAPTPSTVLISGETGTGKELVARYIHNLSNRKKMPFIKVNCAALASGVLESELFGHEKGAFSGAVKNRKGRFELADKGTLFLDEISEVDINTQSKLLRVLQEQEFEKVGGEETLKVDVRIIAATNKNLEELVKKNKFRKDLFYRLNVIPIVLNSLKDRLEDIPDLIYYFIKKYNKRLGKNVLKISESALRCFENYDWPGNIRELENIIERIIVLTNDSVIMEKNIPIEIKNKNVLDLKNIESEDFDLKDITLPKFISNIEIKLIKNYYKKNNFNQTKTAEQLGISRSDLQYKIKKYNITKDD